MFRNSVRSSSFLAPPSVITRRTRLRMGDDERKSIAAATRLMNQYAGTQAEVFSQYIPRFSVRNNSVTGRLGLEDSDRPTKRVASDDKLFSP
mmetsp:Transcript_28490/g.111619  ORF Transcript_28490/g.111619 Transcript_28490/m.111619 type:complete len:92 (+) Transcript_28490:179-454(+)